MASPKQRLTIATEDNEAAELITIDRVALFRFTLDPITRVYNLFGGQLLMQHLTKLLKSRQIEDDKFANTLSSLETCIKENSRKPKKEYKSDTVTMKLIGASWLLMLISFILMIIGAYYADSDEICYVGLAFAVPGLFIHVLIMIKNGGGCKRKENVKVQDDGDWGKVEQALTEVNAYWKRMGLRWRVEEATCTLMLQDLK
jgi:hypothetical protein